MFYCMTKKLKISEYEFFSIIIILLNKYIIVKKYCGCDSNNTLPNKVIQQLNKLMQQWNKVIQQWNKVIQQWNKLVQHLNTVYITVEYYCIYLRQ